MEVWTISHQGSVRKQNQDTCYGALLPTGGALLVVCDGMGGARAGNVASDLACTAFTQTVLTGMEGSGEDPISLLEDGVRLANQRVWSRSKEDPDCAGMGTTLVAALVSEEQWTVANVGDSRAYWITAEGITQISRDHSYVADMVLRGQLTAEAAKNLPQKNLITRALGTFDGVKADLFRGERQEGSFLFLCSDGLSNVVSDQEILYEVLHGGQADTCCSRLLDMALGRGAPDNVTAVLAQL